MVSSMKIIGITGGVGAGKSQILSYIENNYSSKIIRADEAAHLLEEPGQNCYIRLVELLGEYILNHDRTINKARMAECIFKDEDILEKVNNIIHPEVKKYILQQIQYEQKKCEVKYFFIEAALLIEEHYDEIVDEMWYIHSDVEVRAKRLSQQRNYSDEKIADIMAKQLSEAEFRKHCQRVISNNGDLKETYMQIDNILSNEG